MSANVLRDPMTEVAFTNSTGTSIWIQSGRSSKIALEAMREQATLAELAARSKSSRE